MKVLPKSIVERRELNLRQGIKSSLSSIRSIIALVYTLYRSNNRKAVVEYSESTNGGQIKLHSTLENSIKTFLGIDDLTSINNNPLFKSQMEALQVGIELIFKLGKVEFIDSTLASSAERTGGNRYNKRIRFGTNIQIVDTFLSSYEADLSMFLRKWLQNQESEKGVIDDGIKKLLTIFSEETQFKIRYNNQEISFQQEGIYKEFASGNTVVGRDEHENVGPFRVFKSYVKEGLHPYISENGDEFIAKNSTTDALEYYQIVSNALDLIPKRTLITSFVATDAGLEDDAIAETNECSDARQIIYYGAPGTGKSHTINRETKGHKTCRTTFHPDTDYSSFVGAYKPTSVEVPMLTTLGEKAIPVKDMEGNPLTENKIIYTYVKQAFLNAYIEAWKEQEKETPQPVYLVIEEINRGNCAQIFGDIFQLLDRNTNGFSDYAIVPDADLSRHMKKDLEKLVIANKEGINAIYEECEEDMVDKVVNGKVLLLPNNLYIWATMNTSDQSLFPIDSAFKRRWDWKYIKIADAHKNWQIKVGTKTYDWWQFVQAINYFVFDATQSEDKNLGYFFAKASKGGIINAETFVSKVIFYLYTDVFKDYGFSGDIFKGANDDEMTFQSFYNADGSPCESQIIRFIENVMFSDALPETLRVAVSTEDEDMNVYDEDEAVDNRQSSNRDKFMVNGAGSYGKCLAPFEAVKAYSKQNPQMNAAEIVQVWSNLNVNHMPHLVETEQDFEERAKTTKDVKFRVKAKRLELPNGEVIYVSNQFNPIRIAELIEKLNKANLGVNISLIEH